MKFRNSKSDIGDFLAEKRIAVIGVSKDSKDFSRQLFRQFIESGYDVIPVNPSATEIEGRKCYATARDIEPDVSAALLMTPASATDSVVQDCAARGITHIWMYGVSNGGGAVTEDAVKYCREHDLQVVAGECPFMFLPHTGWPHRIHGIIRKIGGSYPK